MKTAIAAMLLTAAFVGPSQAGSGIKIERPCGTKCAAPQPQPQVRVSNFYATCCEVGTVPYRELKTPATIEARTVIRSALGTSVIDSAYRFSSR